MEKNPSRSKPPLLRAFELKLTVICSLVFVHGLGGHPENTWTYEAEGKSSKRLKSLFVSSRSSKTSGGEAADQKSTSTFWPRDLLAEQLPNVRLLTYGYDADPTQFFNSVNRMSLFNHATEMLTVIAGEREGHAVGTKYLSDIGPR